MYIHFVLKVVFWFLLTCYFQICFLNIVFERPGPTLLESGLGICVIQVFDNDRIDDSARGRPQEATCRSRQDSRKNADSLAKTEDCEHDVAWEDCGTSPRRCFDIMSDSWVESSSLISCLKVGLIFDELFLEVLVNRLHSALAFADG